MNSTDRNEFGYPCTKDETCVRFPPEIQLSELQWMVGKLGLRLEYTTDKGYKAVRIER